MRPSSHLTSCESYVVAAFTSVGAYRGTVGMLGGEMPHALDAMIASGKAGGTDRSGQSVYAAQFSQSDGLPGDFQHGGAERDRGGTRCPG